MEFLKILIPTLVALLLVVGLETIIFLKRMKERPVEEFKKQMLVRVNILMVLTVFVGASSILFIILRG